MHFKNTVKILKRHGKLSMT